MPLELQGIVESVHSGGQAHLTKDEADTVTVHLDGFEGDKHRGVMRKADSRTPHIPRGTEIPNDRMWSGVSKEELAVVAQTMGIRELAAATIGANVCISGIPNFSNLPKGTKLVFPNGAVLVVEGQNEPCTDAGKEIERVHTDEQVKGNRFPKAAMGKRGVVGVVEQAGQIAKGDAVRVLVSDEEKYGA